MAEYVLVGGPAVGKTTVGQLLASQLGIDFYDVDQEIEQRSDMTIAELFAAHGEPYFRSLERDVVVELLNCPGVLSLGGGAVLDARTRADLAKAEHLVIWLQCSPITGSHRVGLTTHRPLLAGDVPGRLRELHEKRAGLYAEVSDLIINTDQLSPQQVVEEILERSAS